MITGTADRIEARRAAEPSAVQPSAAEPSAAEPSAAEPSAAATPSASTATGAHVGVDFGPADMTVRSSAPSKLQAVVLITQAKQALVGLGWKPAVASAAASDACAALEADATLERLIFEALRRCPLPSAVPRRSHSGEIGGPDSAPASR